MSYIAGIDIGNSTTEVCVGEVGAAGTVHFLTSASCPTTGTKGTPANLHGIKAALKQAMAQIGQEIDALSCIRLNEAAPVIGDTAMEIIETPGHTPGHICLYNKDEKLLITGDTLFRESIGRTDLPGGDYSWIMRSILDKLMPLGGDVHFYPGHGQDSTIGHEALYNPFVTEVLGGEVNY